MKFLFLMELKLMAKIIKTTTGEASFVLEEVFESEESVDWAEAELDLIKMVGLEN